MIILFSLYINILKAYCDNNAIIFIYYYNIIIVNGVQMHVCAHMQMEQGLSLTSMGDWRAVGPSGLQTCQLNS